MQRSPQPQIELDRAAEAITAMETAGDLDTFEEHWKEFLRRIERSWNKTIAHYGKSPKWSGWCSKYERARKIDPLLSYLINARGAEEHTVNEITERSGNSIAINPAFGNELYIESLTINQGKIDIKSPMPIKIDFQPARTRLVAVVNRGKTYNVPTSHLGQAVDHENVIRLAQLAQSYYTDAISSAEAFFVK
jgi:hypothetical protein